MTYDDYPTRIVVCMSRRSALLRSRAGARYVYSREVSAL